MRRAIVVFGVIALTVAVAAPAFADTQPSARDIQSAVDGYLQGGEEARLVGGPGSAGYDGGFWIRGGDFSLKINLTLQARYEAFDFDDSSLQESSTGFFTGGDLSGFSLPRATLKLSGTAPCNICYYMELEFGHWGEDVLDLIEDEGPGTVQPLGGSPLQSDNLGGFIFQSFNYDNTREAWIEWCYCPVFNVRMGQVKTPTTRQMMVAPEMQQFVDVSLASSHISFMMPGYTDRNRDHGVLFHGAFGCENEFSYIVGVTNGDGGDSIRNVLDPRTDDNLAYSARFNWAFAKPIGYQEGALNFDTCSFYGEAGVWGHFYADRFDKDHTQVSDSVTWGVDVALGYGGFSFTGAFSMATWGDTDDNPIVWDFTTFLAQLGYHFPGTAWEVAARWSTWTHELDASGVAGPTVEGTTTEFAFGVNYYLNGHGNKLQLDASFFSGSDAESILIGDPYSGIPLLAGIGDETYGVLIRFQWQLAL
jgi:hypothetical protein